MPIFGKKSLERLATCDANLQLVAKTVIKSFGFSITEGHRGEQRQHEFFLTKRSKVDWPLGEHNKLPSKAFDFIPDSVTWDDLNGVNGKLKQQQGVATCYLLAGHLLMAGEMLGVPLRSGADWDGDKDLMDQNFNDIVHIEMVS